MFIFISLPWTSFGQTTVTVSAVEAAAAEATGVAAVFRLQRIGDTSDSLDVRFQLEGTARRGDDYSVDPEPVNVGFGRVSATIPPGSDFLDVSVLPAVDNLAEGGETVIVRLSTGGYDIGDPNEATMTIVDDPAVVNVTAPDPAAGETGPDPGRFQFDRTGGDLSGPLTVRFELNGQAAVDADYELQPTPVAAGFGRFNLTIPANQSSLEVLLTPITDAAAEDDETATLRLSPNTAFVAGTADSATIVIADDAAVVTVTGHTQPNPTPLPPSTVGGLVTTTDTAIGDALRRKKGTRFRQGANAWCARLIEQFPGGGRAPGLPCLSSWTPHPSSWGRPLLGGSGALSG